MLGIGHGPLWWLMTSFQYSILLLIVGILIRQVISFSGLYRTQALLLLVPFVLVFGANVVYVTGNSPIPNVDFSPIGFTVVAGAMALGFSRFNLLEISPVAKAEIFRRLDDAILVLDSRNRVIELNPAAEDLFKINYCGAIGKGAHQLFSRYPQLLEFSRDLKQTEIFLEVDGQNRAYDINVSILNEKSGAALGRIIALRNITKRKQTEDEKERLESELRHVKKMEALGTLAGGIAHDFNNILMAIIGCADLALRDNEKGVSNSRRIDEILKAGARAKDLVTQILTFSRKVKPELTPLDLNQVVVQTEKMLARTIPKMIRIELRLKDDLWLTNADSGQVAQVLLNLGANAKDAMPEGGTLVIKTENVVLEQKIPDQRLEASAGEYVLLTVRDTGHGMDRETQEHIFEPFFTNKEMGKGTGLGLATVYGIVKNHGGQIACSSEIGRGTTIRVYLPANRSGKGAQQTALSLEKSPRGGDETVLFVDDEKTIRDLGREMLAYNGYQVLLACTGEEALELYREHGADIDLVVLDISMPGMGGRKCLEELLQLNPLVRVLIISGYSLTGQLKDIMSNGAAGFVAKPFSITELLTSTREVLDRR